MSWEYLNINEICRPRQWKTLSMDKLLPKGFPVYGANGRIGFYSEYTHELPTLAITCRGATCGSVHITEPKSYINGNAMALDNISDKINIKFLYYYFIQRGFNDVISGSAQPQITGEGLSSVAVPLPPLATQKRIAEILDAADALRCKDQELLKKYDELAQAIFIDMFGDPVKNEKGWEVKTIEQLVLKTKHSIKRGPFGGALKKEIFVNDGYLVYEQFHALNNDFSFGRYYINEEKYNELIAFDVKPKDIIISCSGIYLGKLAIVPLGVKPGIINQALLKLTLDENVYKNEFFVKVFTQENFKETYFSSERGAAIPNFPPMATFKEFKFICPPIKIQNDYLTIVKKMQNQLAITSTEKHLSTELFQTIIQKAFKGELV
jgi:type I restriction enzyme S subunit